MTVWNYGILLRGIAQKDPNRLAQVFGGKLNPCLRPGGCVGVKKRFAQVVQQRQGRARLSG